MRDIHEGYIRDGIALVEPNHGNAETVEIAASKATRPSIGFMIAELEGILWFEMRVVKRGD